jgi:hypothetical protein
MFLSKPLEVPCTKRRYNKTLDIGTCKFNSCNIWLSDNNFATAHVKKLDLEGEQF